MSRKYISATLALLLVGSACTKSTAPVAPRDILAKYVETAFGMKAPGDVEELKKLTTGSANQDLAALEANPEAFREQFVDRKYQPGSLRIRDERKVDEDTYSITYELTYRDQTPEGSVPSRPPVLSATGKTQYADAPKQTGAMQTKPASEDRVTTKKNVLFKKDANGAWLITEVQNLKTVIEHNTDENISGAGKQENSAH